MGIITNIATRIAAAAGSTLTRLRFNSWTLGGRGAEIFEKSAEALELERLNPLRGVDEWRLGQIFDDARDGIYADLAWLYNEIEGVEPALVACCEMREAAASECGWLVKTADATRTRGFDQVLADEQRAALLAEFGAIDDDLAELAGHLVSAFFRGAAHAQPLWNADGSLAGFRALDLWNFAFDRASGIWYWNADASRDEATFLPIPPGELVTLAVSSSRHVDHAALPIFIRAALGAKRYGVWLDRFGIPPVAVVMPPNAERGEQQNYMELARKFARGGSGVLPNGSQVSYGTETRAVCPFIDFIRFQQQQIYAIGIGRVQSGETDGANLGGNAAGVVESGFRRIVRRDARRIARAINETVTRKVLARLFSGKPALAQFAWDTEVKRTSREVLEDAVVARNASLVIDIDQIQELTGYTLTQATVSGPDGSSMSLEQLSQLIYPLKAAGYTIQKEQLEQATKLKLDDVQTGDETPPRALNSHAHATTALQNDEKALQNASSAPDGQGHPPAPPGPQIAKIRPPAKAALAADTAPVAALLRELAENPSPERAAEIKKRLEALSPDAPALALALAEASARAMFKAAVDAAGGGVAKNSGTSEGARKGWETRRRNGWTPEQLAANKATVEALIADIGRRGPSNSKAWKNEPKDLGEVSQTLADEIRVVNPDMQVTAGTMQTIDQDQLNHALEDHGVGKETRPNQIPITVDDLKRIPEVLSDYDEIRRGLGKADGKQQEGVIFRKKYSDGTVSCVEIDWFRRKDNRRELKFQTMWKEMPEEVAKK